MSLKNWDKHYNREISKLSYPDENLVRMLAKNINGFSDPETLWAADIGCGSGRHLKLLAEFGIKNIIGIDYSMPSLKISSEMPHSLLINCDNENIALKDEKIDLAICWGSLHYSTKESFIRQITQVYRIMKPGAFLMGTLRSSRDSYLKHGREISPGVWQTSLDSLEGAIASFYGEDELKKHFAPFGKFSYGLMERTIPGEMDRLISHWYYTAVK